MHQYKHIRQITLMSLSKTTELNDCTLDACWQPTAQLFSNLANFSFIDKFSYLRETQEKNEKENSERSRIRSRCISFVMTPTCRVTA